VVVVGFLLLARAEPRGRRALGARSAHGPTDGGCGRRLHASPARV